MRAGAILSLILMAGPVFAQGSSDAASLARDERSKAEAAIKKFEADIAKDDDLIRRARQAGNAAAQGAAEQARTADQTGLERAKVNLRRADLWLSALDAASRAGLSSVPAVATVVKGDVKVKRANGQEGTLGPGSAFMKGDRIMTGPGASVELRFSDGSAVMLGGGTDFVLTEPPTSQSKSMFDLLAGYLHFETGARFKPGGAMRTPTAVAAVRGTGFDVAVEKSGLTTVRPYHGTVEVSATPAAESAVRGWWQDMFK